MDSHSIVVQSGDNGQTISVTVKKPSLRYFDELLRMRCMLDLLGIGVFPNAKEITESFGAKKAAQQYFDFQDGSIQCLVVGDGVTPRTGALLAFCTKWHIVSIDPLMRSDDAQRAELNINRLVCYAMCAEEFVRSREYDFIGDAPVIIIAVHSHARLEAIYPHIGNLIGVIAIPCCVQQLIPNEILDSSQFGTGRLVQYDDYGIWSPQRTVKVWVR